MLSDTAAFSLGVPTVKCFGRWLYISQEKGLSIKGLFFLVYNAFFD